MRNSRLPVIACKLGWLIVLSTLAVLVDSSINSMSFAINFQQTETRATKVAKSCPNGAANIDKRADKISSEGSKEASNRDLSEADMEVLSLSMEKFVDSLRAMNVEKFLSLFSHSTQWRYVGTITVPHSASIVRYDELATDLKSETGWYEALFDAQGDDCFRDYVVSGGSTTWQYAGNAKFIPPGYGMESPVFVRWRKEGKRWVVAEIGEPAG